MKERWTKEQAWEWYNKRPWMRGCNYMSADCANRVDQWQELGFEERFKTTEEEFKLLRETGFNTIRIILEFVVWQQEHDGFMERFERYLSLCEKYGISCVVVLANDCMPPKTELWRLPYVGEQQYDWGYHGGKKHSQHGVHSGPAPHFYLDDEETRTEYLEMVKEIVTTYKDDERICVWDVFNEPGNSRRAEITLPNVKKVFETVRACDPSQPLTAGVFAPKGDENIPWSDVERYILDNSDIVSYHSYSQFLNHMRFIKRLKKEGRPLINTEWLGRTLGNYVHDNFPVFYMEKIGCLNWGFVAGKYQTYEPWEATWKQYEDGTRTDVDFTKWFHDLYRPNHHPYDPKEIELIKEVCRIADEDYEREKSQNSR